MTGSLDCGLWTGEGILPSNGGGASEIPFFWTRLNPFTLTSSVWTENINDWVSLPKPMPGYVTVVHYVYRAYTVYFYTQNTLLCLITGPSADRYLIGESWFVHFCTHVLSKMETFVFRQYTYIGLGLQGLCTYTIQWICIPIVQSSPSLL